MVVLLVLWRVVSGLCSLRKHQLSRVPLSYRSFYTSKLLFFILIDGVPTQNHFVSSVPHGRSLAHGVSPELILCVSEFLHRHDALLPH